MMQRVVVVLLTLFCAPALGYDSKACGTGSADCEGLRAAREPWIDAEHALIWQRTREHAGLPSALDQTFVVSNWSMAASVSDASGDFATVANAPLDIAETHQAREVRIAPFAQLPDKAYTLWDWASGNEGCPPTGTEMFEGCHGFEQHMGWLNSNHFMPQSEQLFFQLHHSAVARARECAQLATALPETPLASDILQACDREALVLEAVAHHYLQDAWSMGHMWERWGSPESSDFVLAVASDPELATMQAVGLSIGAGSGMIHGAQAITGFEDAMCSPNDGVRYAHHNELHFGAGDLHLEQVEFEPALAEQKAQFYACTTTAMREVYAASSRAFGPLAASSFPQANLQADCFVQRALNQSIAVGAAVQIPVDHPKLTAGATMSVTSMGASAAGIGAPVVVAGVVSVAAAVYFTHRSYLDAIGIDVPVWEEAENTEPPPRADPLDDAVDAEPIEPDFNTLGINAVFIPLTSDLLLQANLILTAFGRSFVDRSVENRWQVDMASLNTALVMGARLDPEGTGLASGEMGPLLGMQPNSAYDASDLSYRDPAPPYEVAAIDVSLEPLQQNAGNILARTFVDAHAKDWCDVLHEEGDDEFSINRMKERCQNESLDDEARETACGICTKFASWFAAVDPEEAPLAPLSICQALSDKPGIVMTASSGQTLPDVANTWCSESDPEYAFNVSGNGSQRQDGGGTSTFDAAVIGTASVNASATSWTLSGELTSASFSFVSEGGNPGGGGTQQPPPDYRCYLNDQNPPSMTCGGPGGDGYAPSSFIVRQNGSAPPFHDVGIEMQTLPFRFSEVPLDESVAVFVEWAIDNNGPDALPSYAFPMTVSFEFDSASEGLTVTAHAQVPESYSATVYPTE